MAPHLAFGHTAPGSGWQRRNRRRGRTTRSGGTEDPRRQCHVGEVGTDREAESRVQQLDPDVVLMDIAMPDLNGIEAARLIHAKCPAVRIVMLSMHATAEYVYRAFEAGASGYLLKEAAVEELITAVRTVHEGRRYLSPAVAESVPDLSFGHARSPVDSLSARERQVLQLVVEGGTSSEIARVICLSPKSVQTYRSRLTLKLGVSDVPSLVKFALEHGLTPPK